MCPSPWISLSTWDVLHIPIWYGDVPDIPGMSLLSDSYNIESRTLQIFLIVILIFTSLSIVVLCYPGTTSHVSHVFSVPRWYGMGMSQTILGYLLVLAILGPHSMSLVSQDGMGMFQTILGCLLVLCYPGTTSHVSHVFSVQRWYRDVPDIPGMSLLSDSYNIESRTLQIFLSLFVSS